MSFNKSELQSIRVILSEEIRNLQMIIDFDSHARKGLFAESDPENPDTAELYRYGKTVSNRLLANRKKLDRKEALLRKLKLEIQNLPVQKSFVERFFAFVRGE